MKFFNVNVKLNVNLTETPAGCSCRGFTILMSICETQMATVILETEGFNALVVYDVAGDVGIADGVEVFL